jgi:NAD-dependent deacetylase
VSVERLADLVRRRGPAVVLTGAGISTESGIPDFRSREATRRGGKAATPSVGAAESAPQGIWAQYDPAEYATIDAFRADPRKVWSFYSRRLRVLVEAEPNAGHLALAELERAGRVSAVVTQNIDGLHGRAGSRDVVEVHGSIRSSTCPACAATYELDELLELLRQGADSAAPTEAVPALPVRPVPSEAPECLRCGAIVKPDVVMFGELLPEALIERAYALARSTGLLLVVGSTLEVWPVSMLPGETVAAGGEVAIVNRGPTSFDGRAAVKIDGGAGETLAALGERLS